MMDRSTRPLVIVGAFAGSMAVGLMLMLWALGGLKHATAPAAIGGPFQLTDHTGQIVTEKNLKGRPTLIFFGFTHCPDVCPISLFEISEVLRVMGRDAKVPLKDGDYTMDHTTLTYLMDRDGKFVTPFNLKRTPEEAAADLRRYM